METINEKEYIVLFSASCTHSSVDINCAHLLYVNVHMHIHILAHEHMYVLSYSTETY
jgi:hypothetical protein